MYLSRLFICFLYLFSSLQSALNEKDSGSEHLTSLLQQKDTELKELTEHKQQVLERFLSLRGDMLLTVIFREGETFEHNFIPAILEGRKQFFYLTTHSIHFIYGYMASDIW